MSLTKATYSMISGASVNVLDYGAVGDGVTDDYAAFVAAQAALPLSGGCIIVGATSSNVFRLSQTLNLTKNLALIGQVATLNATSAGTTLLFDAGVSGIVMNCSTSLGYTTVAPSASTPGCDYGVIQNLRVKSAGGPTGTGTNVDGIFIRAVNVLLQNVLVTDFKRNGFRILANVAGGADLQGNANVWGLYHCYATNNGSDGFFTQGDNANRGTAINCTATLNQGWGFHEDTLLGNTYVGCEAEGNTTQGAYKANRVSSHSEFFGCYEEAHGAGSDITYPHTVFGGTYLSGWSATTDALRLINTVPTPRARGRRQTSQSIPNTTTTAIAFDGDVFVDVGGVHSATVNNTRFTVPFGFNGAYSVNVTVQWAASAAGTVRVVRIYKDGAPWAWSQKAPSAVQVSDSISIIDNASAGSYYEVFVYQDSGGALNVLGTDTIVNGTTCAVANVSVIAGF